MYEFTSQFCSIFNYLKESGSARLPSNSDGERLPLAACLDLQYWFFILCKSMRKCYLNIFSNFCNSPPSPSLHKSDSLTGDGVPRNDQELTAWFTSSRVPPAPTCRFLRMGIGELPRGSSTIPWMWSLVSCSFLLASLKLFQTDSAFTYEISTYWSSWSCFCRLSYW